MPLQLLERNASMTTLNDLMKIYMGQEKCQPDAQSYVDDARRMNSWSDDPDESTPHIDKRLRGDFKYARELMKKVNVGSVAGNIQSLHPEIEFGRMTGTEVDMDAYLRGESRCLGTINMPELENGERVMRIAVGIGGNCMVTSEELVRRAAIVLKVVEEYSEAGYQVEVYAFCAVRKCNKNENAVAIIDCSKSAAGQVISAMASTKFFRTMIFALLAILPDIGYGLGYPINHTQQPEKMNDITARLKKVLGSNTKVIHAGANEKQVREALR